jgi:uncharacterized RDD family membrane protein YckC
MYGMAAADSSVTVVEDGYEDTIITGEAVALELRPTGFALAAAGAVIDWLLYFVGGSFLLIFGVLLPVATTSIGQDSAVLSAFVSAGIVVILVVIPTAVETATKGKSLGRFVVGARIVREDGGSIGFRHAFIRQIMALVEIYLTLGGVAAAFGLLNGKSKRAGDFFAGTYSQYERASKVLEPVFGVPSSLEAWALTADVARIPNRLAQRLTKFLRQAAALTPSTRDHFARQLATEASVYVSPVPQVDPELFIAAVVAVRRDREFAALTLENERLAQLDTALTGLPFGFPSADRE